MERELFVLKDATASTLPSFMKVLRTMDDIEFPDTFEMDADMEINSEHGWINDELEDDDLQTASYVVSRMKSHIAVQLPIIQVATDLYKMWLQFLSAANIKILLYIFSSVTLHVHELNTEIVLGRKLQKMCSILELSDPPVVHFENESYQNYLNFLQDSLTQNPSVSQELNIELHLVEVYKDILQIYLVCTGSPTVHKREKLCKLHVVHWILPLGYAKKEELAARSSWFRVESVEWYAKGFI